MALGSTRRIIVTGADSTARTIAERFCTNGDKVSVCDIRNEAIESIAEANPNIFALQADMGNAASIDKFISSALEQMGGVDFLINVVGIPGPTKPTEDITLEEWEQSLTVNLTAMFLTTRATIPYLKDQRFGGIVNFSSGSTRTLLPNRSAYIVSKFGVEGLTRNLARELGPFNVRANAILPGAINNDRMRAVTEKVAAGKGVSYEQASKDLLKYVSMRTMIEVDEIADTIFFLCSDAARHITGQLMGIDGNTEWEE
ncbi:MAG: SDR family oxidoreductase [Pseudomonadota bacterium]